jgi:hypothetical protein
MSSRYEHDKVSAVVYYSFADPDPAFHFNADPDPAFLSDADTVSQKRGKKQFCNFLIICCL